MELLPIPEKQEKIFAKFIINKENNRENHTIPTPNSQTQIPKRQIKIEQIKVLGIVETYIPTLINMTDLEKTKNIAKRYRDARDLAQCEYGTNILTTNFSYNEIDSFDINQRDKRLKRVPKGYTPLDLIIYSFQ